MKEYNKAIEQTNKINRRLKNYLEDQRIKKIAKMIQAYREAIRDKLSNTQASFYASRSVDNPLPNLRETFKKVKAGMEMEEDEIRILYNIFQHLLKNL